MHKRYKPNGNVIPRCSEVILKFVELKATKDCQTNIRQLLPSYDICSEVDLGTSALWQRQSVVLLLFGGLLVGLAFECVFFFIYSNEVGLFNTQPSLPFLVVNSNSRIAQCAMTN